MRILVGASSCGISAGALNVVSALERALAKKGKSSLKVETTGCIGMCFALQVFPVSTLISYAIGIPVGLMGIVIVILTPLLYQSVFPKTKKME